MTPVRHNADYWRYTLEVSLIEVSSWFNICSVLYKINVMKSIHFYKKVKVIYSVALAAMIFVLVESCTRKIHFTTSNIVPAAQGTVKMKKDDNNNYSIQINVKNLATPARLQPPKSVYVVWAETAGKSAQNLGQLKTSSGMFSKALKASLNAISSFKPTRIFITAEDRSDIEYPGSYTILNTTSF